MSLPSFLVIGPPKAGTTTIYRYLRSSDRVFVPSSKEPRFFNFWGEKIDENDPVNVNVIQSLGEYRGLFSSLENNYEERGDVSPTYLYDPDVPKKVHNLIPNVKVITVLRNPVERAFSHFTFAKQKGFEPEPTSFRTAIEEDTVRVNNFVRERPYVQIGFYWRHISRWLSFFPREKMKVMFFEDLKNEEEAFMRKMFHFLKVRPDFSLQGNVKYAKSGEPKIRLIHNVLSNPGPVAGCFKALLPERTLKTIRRIVDPVRTKLKNWNLEKPSLSTETYNELANVYEDDICQLEKEVDRDLSHWLEPSCSC